jgi:hypothetical protein
MRNSTEPKKLLAELRVYDIAIPPTKVFSSATLGKYALGQLRIKPFLDCQPDFSFELLGYIMSAYYGGRTECRIRKTPTKVSVLDFTSMYPTISMLLDIWKFVIADGVETEIVTDKITEFVATIDLEKLQNQDVWKKFVVLVQVLPDDDVLPVRMDYKGDKRSFNVGINYLTSSEPLWYALPDIIASKLLTGKFPKILKAIRFYPKDVQKGLKASQILGIPIDPVKDKLVQLLVEKRQKIKQKLKTSPDGFNHAVLSSRETAMKILVNAMSYGIFIELNPEDKKSEIQVSGVDTFTTKKNHFEKPGKFYHPLLAVMITAGSRLFLAMAETKLLEKRARHAYMDTDSIFVPPEYAPDIIDYFEPLNPYMVSLPLLKVEKENVLFYGISSKRYALYKFENGKITFLDGERSFKLHGLGHLTNPFPNSQTDWQADIWRDILNHHYGLITPLALEQKYSNFYAIAKMTISTAYLWDRFETLNKGKKDWNQQIKPFNFFLVGFQMVRNKKKTVKPLSPYSKDPQTIVHEPFIDYETGETKQGLHYFKPLSKTISQYCDHKEFKFKGDVGLLTRKHVHGDWIIHIGKEANNINEEPLRTGNVQIFKDIENERQRILAMRQCDAEKLGIDRKTRWRMKNANNNITRISLPFTE